jgi:hypothetical protein
VFGLDGELVVTIPDSRGFYSLYADGLFSRKTYLKDSGETLLAYPPKAAVFLYYTYPAHRAVSLVRNEPGGAGMPGLSKTTRLLFTLYASRVDKLRRAVGFLNKNALGAYRYDDAFYLRLYFLLRRRGKLSYLSLRRMAGAAESLQGDRYADSL